MNGHLDDDQLLQAMEAIEDNIRRAEEVKPEHRGMSLQSSVKRLAQMTLFSFRVMLDKFAELRDEINDIHGTLDPDEPGEQKESEEGDGHSVDEEDRHGR